MKWKITHNREINVFVYFFKMAMLLLNTKKKVITVKSGGCFKSGNFTKLPLLKQPPLFK